MVVFDYDCTLSTKTPAQRVAALSDHNERYISEEVRQLLRDLLSRGLLVAVASYAPHQIVVDALRAATISESMLPAEYILTLDDFTSRALPFEERHRLVPKSRMLDELRRRTHITNKHRVMLVDDDDDNYRDALAHGYLAFLVPGGEDDCRGLAALL